VTLPLFASGRVPLLEITQAAFARHNTFHPRFGWLKKGFDEAVRDGRIFARPDAPVVLGVGKNMVRAIRYWLLATQLVKEAPGGEGVAPTAFGESLLSDQGWDPYLEDLGSLWLLHWRLIGNADLATAWWLTFYQSTRHEFGVEELTSFFSEFLARRSLGARISEDSLRKDASCIVRMYGELPKRALSEESIHCPFAELGLMRPTGRRTYMFSVGAKPGLSNELIAAAACEYAAAAAPSAKTVAVASILHAPGGPGLAFRLGESALYAALEEATAAEPTLALSDAGGLVQVSFADDPLLIADRLLSRHYERAFTEAV
jgi:hypothetical protein